MRKYDLRVSNLARTTRKADIIKLFEAAGFPIEFSWTITPESGKTFCDVNLKNSADSHKAVAALDGAELHDSRISVRVFHARVTHVDGKVCESKATQPGPRVGFHRPAPESWARHQAGTTNEAEAAR